MNAAEPELKKLVDLELEAANRENPPFHSAHEGYAVILEELDETRSAMAAVGKTVEYLWTDVMRNMQRNFAMHAEILEKNAVRAAAEALQVAAMARKFRQLGGTKMDAKEAEK